MARGDARLRRGERLLRPREFRRVGRSARRAASRNFVVLTTRDPGRERIGPRLGITASRRVGGAVSRNRAKRLVREWFRRSKRAMEEDRDVVVIARSGAPGLAAGDASRELCGLLEQAGAGGDG